jgi:hypothetical protein
VIEFQAQTVDKHLLAGGVRDELGFSEVLPGQSQRESPGQQVVLWFPPDAAFEGSKWLAPE